MLSQAAREPRDHEFLQAQVEVDTRVCLTVAEARRELIELRAAIAETAREFGMAMIASLTHPANWRVQRRVVKSATISSRATWRRSLSAW